VSTEVALPPTDEVTAGVPTEQPETEQATGEEQAEKQERPEKTPEQRELAKKDRRIDTLTRREAMARAELQQLRQQVAYTKPQDRGTNHHPNDDTPVTYTQSKIDAMVLERAKQIAVQLAQDQSVEVQRRTTAQGIAKELGADKFETYTTEVDVAMGGMADENGHLKPATEAIFEVEPKVAAGILEYLADPDNADEAEALGRMSALKAGIAIAKLETKVKALAESRKAKDKPQPSDVPAPIERLKGSGQPASAPQDSDSIDVWLKKERARLEAKRKAR
jgi:hypothetical protein